MRQPIDTRTRFEQLATALAGMPTVVATLLRTHTADSQGRCRGCGMPGTGTPYRPAPCSLWALASAAHTLRRRGR